MNGHSVQWLILRSRYEIPWICAYMFVNAIPAQLGKLGKMIHQELPSLVSTYKTLRGAPEISHYEENVPALCAR